MNEVSTKVLMVFHDALKAKGKSLDVVVRNTQVSAAHLRDSRARVDWTDFVTMMGNLRTVFTDEEYLEIGRSYMRSPGLRFGAVIARLMFSAMDFYRWMNKPREGLGNQMFTCIVPSHRELAPNIIEMDLTLAEGYEECWDFFLVSKGNMEELPRLLGLPRAEVELSRIPRGGRYRVTVPLRVPLFGRIWRVLRYPFTIRTAGRELKEAHENLLERFEELNAAKGKLAEYQVGLEKLVDQRTAELTQARDQLAGTVEQLREAQGARQRFFGNISHEIRTPLSLILLAAGDIQARAGDKLDARSRGGLDAVSDSARKLVRLVDELLLLAAGQEDKLKLRPEHTDLTSLLTNLVAAWRPAAEAAGLEIEARLAPDVYANVDATAIERIASNLTSNAVKYTPRGGRIEIALAVDADGIHLDVLDSGVGITPELAARLFGRFERDAGETGRTQHGTGLGLALVKQLVEAHGGTISAAPRDTGGTALHVTLPRAVISSQVEARLGRSPRASASARLEDYGVVVEHGITSGTVLSPPGVSRGTILLAEDDGRLAAMIAGLLADEYTVVVALDGFAALDQVKKHQPQVLITDVDMPGMSGIELAKKFRETTGDKLAPIIILSAVHDLGTRVAGLEAGAVDYVTKPFDPVELKARVAAQFRMRDLALRLHRAEQLSALGILTAGLAHELRNPANGIVNAAAPLKDLLPPELTHPDTGVGQLLEVMTGCADQIAFLSRQLLSFRTGVGTLELREVKVAELLRRAISLAERSTDGIDIRLSITAETIMCAPPLMIQVLTNLVENAGHAARKGGWIQIGAFADAGRITIEVSDSGGGVPRELRDRVFEPFFTTKAPGVGTGLGLPLARDIVARHGGLLEIRDRDGRASFVIDVPDRSLSAAANAV